MTQHTLPKCRDDLVIRQTGEGEYVVKLPQRGRFFSIGAVEHFLLRQMDGTQSGSEIRKNFEQEFSAPLSREEFKEFLKLAGSMGLLVDPTGDHPARPADSEDEEEDFGSGRGGSVLFYRLPLYDPDRLFNRIEPNIRWIWTRGFAAFSALAMLAAGMISWMNRAEMGQTLLSSLRWESLLFVGLIVVVATAVHEFAHGLTCKHFGGEVREMGVLMVFFMPCLYCNVSDAWLIPEKWKRMLITLAGGYVDLCMWAMAVFAWRILEPGTVISQVAFVLMTVCGSRGFINLNPLLRLDGYYLLSDGLEIPNLRKRSQEYFMGNLRWLLWGADRPKVEEYQRTLILYGTMIWIFALIFLDMVVLELLELAGDHFGLVGVGFGLVLLSYGLKRVFKGFFASEFVIMLKQRFKRTLVWGLVIGGILLALFTVPMTSWSAGDFRVRGTRHEVVAPVGGFVMNVHPREGSEVEQGQMLFTLESPTLESQISTKLAELDEVQANLRKLRAGTRPEQLDAHSKQLEMLTRWKTRTEQALEKAKLRLEEELRGFDTKIKNAETVLEFQRRTYAQAEWLYRNQAIPGTQLQAMAVEVQKLEAEVAQLQIDRKTRELQGARSEELELIAVERNITEAEGQQLVLRAGYRTEEIEAEAAKEIRLKRELDHLRQRKTDLVVQAPVSGIVTTAHLEEKRGQLVPDGAPLCSIEDSDTANIEIYLPESDIQGVEVGQEVRLKVRALPYEMFQGTVQKIAPVTLAPAQSSTSTQPATTTNMLVVYCRLDDQSPELKSGLTGFARILKGRSSPGMIGLRKITKYIRTEFW